MDDRLIERYFAATPRIAELCSQNGWPDPETLRVQIVERDANEAVCVVSFEEVAMEGSGCIAGRFDCWGRYRLRLNGVGEVLAADLLAGGPATD